MTTTASGCILIVEDDVELAAALGAVVARLGYAAARATDGVDGLRLFFAERPDLVILDVGLPRLDGWQVLERIRDLSEVPIVMLTARDLEADKVRGLRGGADDYVTKPFGISELSARIEALLRRSRRAAPAPAPGTYHHGDVGVDWERRAVTLTGRDIVLTPLEFRLLEVFVQHPNQALSNDQLLELVWNDPLGLAPDRVKFTVLRLRRKLGWQQAEGGPIESVRGFGYRYRPGG